MSVGEVEKQYDLKWIKVIDQTKCIGCHACSVACKSENLVPLSVNRTYVKSVETGIFPQVRRNFQVTRCNQCEDPPCAAICPTGAMYQRPDGIVDFNKSICIGCKACIAACPYDAIFINPDDHSAEKCNFCAHRLEVGLEPACVTVCPTEAILIGNINNPEDKVSKIVSRTPVSVRRPEKATRPKLYYRGAHGSTLDPIAAKQPGGDTFMWSEINRDRSVINSGQVANIKSSNSVSAKLVYDVSHSIPWGWRVSGYTWTKGFATGSALVTLLAVVSGRLSVSSSMSEVAMPLVALIGLAITGYLLIADLKQPKRFIYLFTKPRLESWLVKGGFIISLDGAALVVWLLLPLAHASVGVTWAVGVVLAGASVMTAIYTAYLFAQAKARDLWQNPVRVPHLLVQSLLLGSAAMSPIFYTVHPAETLLLWVGAGACLGHLLVVLIELSMTHPTAHYKAATWHMTKGKFALPFWISVILAVIGLTAPALGMVPLIIAAVGLIGYEHSYIQAGQSVPLA